MQKSILNTEPEHKNKSFTFKLNKHVVLLQNLKCLKNYIQFQNEKVQNGILCN